MRKSGGIGELEIVDLGEVERLRLKQSGTLLKVLLKLREEEGEGLLKEGPALGNERDEDVTNS